MIVTEYVNQIQEDGAVKIVRLIKRYPHSVAVETVPIETEVLELRTVDATGNYITVD